MPANISEARLIANRLNAQKSTGPRTEAGKARSRANAVKHGLTGAGIALPTEDAAEVERRFIAIQGELAPQTVLGAFFAHEIALMTVRCQRAARQEAAALASRVRRAPSEWDEARAAEADHLMGWIGAEPIAYRRKLMATPEGVDRLIGGLRGLKAELAGDQILWDYAHADKLAAYCGRRESDIPANLGKKLSDAIRGNWKGVDPGAIAHLTTDSERVNWACDRLDEFIAGEIAALEAHRATLDLGGLELDRAEAAARATFDGGKEATLARKYEAASKRELYRSLREFRAVEATGEVDPDALAATDAATATLDAGDQVAIGTADRPAPAGREPNLDTPLEKILGSFGAVRPLASGKAGPGGAGVPSGPNQPLDQVKNAERGRPR